MVKDFGCRIITGPPSGRDTIIPNDTIVRHSLYVRLPTGGVEYARCPVRLSVTRKDL